MYEHQVRLVGLRLLRGGPVRCATLTAALLYIVGLLIVGHPGRRRSVMSTFSCSSSVSHSTKAPAGDSARVLFSGTASSGSPFMAHSNISGVRLGGLG